MQIRIEIDVKPEELRRFLGLPDVAGLQEDLIQFVREKVGAASEGFDPANFVKENLQSLRESSAWRKLVSAAKATTETVVPEPVQKAAGRRRGAGGGKSKRAGSARKGRAATSSEAESEQGVD